MAAKHSLAAALRTVRKARGLSQEAFSDVSSRTYLSVLERDLKSPTLSKLGDICEVLNVHPVTLLVLAYSDGSREGEQTVLTQVLEELRELRRSPDA
ncbi:helix-turn-helix domain-containing protein [Achromobacter mucicolens]|uniref:helix-turn-helix domain-containing protein n=1 Tax=Achromobacter TaxID=222 RepID=UPI0009E7EC1B|nr:MULTISPECIES: helix-turn-helix transcriptional regulator [Achromobacter]MDG9969786.1 helix-turn-helix domain-containing protein [Achromobacter mucicolens]